MRCIFHRDLSEFHDICEQATLRYILFSEIQEVSNFRNFEISNFSINPIDFVLYSVSGFNNCIVILDTASHVCVELIYYYSQLL